MLHPVHVEEVTRHILKVYQNARRPIRTLVKSTSTHFNPSYAKTGALEDNFNMFKKIENEIYFAFFALFLQGKIFLIF